MLTCLKCGKPRRFKLPCHFCNPLRYDQAERILTLVGSNMMIEEYDLCCRVAERRKLQVGSWARMQMLIAVHNQQKAVKLPKTEPLAALLGFSISLVLKQDLVELAEKNQLSNSQYIRYHLVTKAKAFLGELNV